jgi:uncharacterized membrane protein
MFPRTTSDATPPRYICITSPSRSSPTKTQSMALLRRCAGLAGRVLRPMLLFITTVLITKLFAVVRGNICCKGDMLVVPANQRGSPRTGPATPNGAVLSE